VLQNCFLCSDTYVSGLRLDPFPPVADLVALLKEWCTTGKHPNMLKCKYRCGIARHCELFRSSTTTSHTRISNCPGYRPVQSASSLDSLVSTTDHTFASTDLLGASTVEKSPNPPLSMAPSFFIDIARLGNGLGLSALASPYAKEQVFSSASSLL
jgi:hypothetical protein